MTPSGPGAPGRCPQCGAVNREDARFCGACGAATSTTEPASSPNLGPAPAMIGREIAGRYRVLAKIGEGGMGAVFRAEQMSLKRTVAVKLLRPDVSADQLLVRRFNAEAEAVAKLSHPNTVNIYDFGQDADGTLFIAMELIEGRSLRAVIQQESPLPLGRALGIAAQIAASLTDAHARAIVHRDLKPDNVMLQDRGRERDVARVLDFGIAKLRDDTRGTRMAMTQQGDMLGTPQYMSPEQVRAEPIDGRTDIYALGCLLYEMVTARLPHEAPTVLAMLSKHLLDAPVPPTQRRPDLGLPPAVDALILGAMAKDPAGRPATMEAFAEQIAALRQTLPPEPRSAQRSVASAAMPGADPPAATPRPVAQRAGAPPAMPGPPSMAGLPSPASFTPPGAPSPYAALPVPPVLPPSFAAPVMPAAPLYGAPPQITPPHAAPSPYAAPPHAPYPAPMPHPPVPFGVNPAGARQRALPPTSLIVVISIAVVVGAAIIGVVAVRSRRQPVIQDTVVSDEPSHGSAEAKPDPWAARPGPEPSKDTPEPVHEAPEPSPQPAVDPDPSDGPDLPSLLPTTPSQPPAKPSRPVTPRPRPKQPSSHAATAGPPDGQKVAVGQGVALVLPPGFRVAAQNAAGVAAFDGRGVMIAGGPIVVATNDIQELVKAHAQLNGLTFDKLTQAPIAGSQRPLALFHGTFQNVPVIHVVAPLIGHGYRVAVAVQFPIALAQDPDIAQLVADVYGRRIVVP